MFALDTNSIIHYLKGLGRVGEHLLAVSPAVVAIPSVVIYELELGTLRFTNSAKRRTLLEAMLRHFSILPLDHRAAVEAASIQAELGAKGVQIGPMDTLIAGIAIAHGAKLVTHNVEEFSRVRRLKTVDWFS